MIAFILTMSTNGAWNGKWSGEGNLYARVQRLAKKKEAELAGKSWTYRWDDGWMARVEAQKVDAKESSRIRKNTKGFCGYGWMIQSILTDGKIQP
jgi:hypothetical protein